MLTATVNVVPQPALPPASQGTRLLVQGMDMGYGGYRTPYTCAGCRQPYSESSASPFDDDLCRECGLQKTLELACSEGWTIEDVRAADRTIRYWFFRLVP